MLRLNNTTEEISPNIDTTNNDNLVLDICFGASTTGTPITTDAGSTVRVDDDRLVNCCKSSEETAGLTVRAEDDRSRNSSKLSDEFAREMSP
jgi:hypothetical protein